MKTIHIVLIYLCAFLPFMESAYAQRGGGMNTDRDNDCIQIFECKLGNRGQITVDDNSINQSNTVIGGRYAVDNSRSTFSRTADTENSFWEASFRTNKSLSDMEICFGSEGRSDFGDGGEERSSVPSEFYVLTSVFPFQSTSLAETLNDPCVSYIHIRNYTNCGPIVLDYIYAQHIRIQHAGTGVICINDIIFWGCLPEVCGNGEDDDGDGLVDCEDDDCAIDIFNVVVTPSSLACDDGSISIQAFADQALTISINGGAPVSCNSLCVIEDLAPGDYTVVIDNGFCPETLQLTVETYEEDTQTSSCNNGSFESGSFEGWTLESSEHGDPWTTEDNTECHDEFQVQTSGQVNDNNIPNGNPVIAPSGSQYYVQLGELNGGEDQYQMTNCFTVDSDNADFCFSFALVLDNPGHGDGEDPWFEWRIYDPVSGLDIASDLISSSDGDFFEQTGNISSRGFTCQNEDLSAFVGTEVCIEFAINECTHGGHGGYALIDGICQDCSENSPSCDFSMPEKVCKNQGLDIDFSATNNFEEYSIQICDGTSCTEENFVEGFTISDISIEEIAADNDFILECNREYSILLKLRNDCGSCENSQSFEYVCAELELDYPECVQGCGNTNFMQIPGNVNCSNCQVQWSPGGYFVNPSNPNPMLATSSWTNDALFNRFYTVMVTTEDGCVAEQEVYVGQVDLSLQNVELDATPACDANNSVYYITGEVELTGLSSWKENLYFDFHDVEIKAYDEINNVYINNIVVEEDDNNANLMTFVVEVDRSVGTQIRIIMEYNSPCAIVNEVHCGDEILMDYVPKADYSGKWRAFLPNIFSPNGDGVNDLYFIGLGGEDKNTTDPCDYTGSDTHVYWYKLSIFDRWGELVFQDEVFDATGTGVKGNEIFWDGTFNGQDAEQGVYAAMYEFENCDSGSYSHCSGSCNGSFCAPHGGYVLTTQDITLIR